jgi:hypothetical protein
MPRKDITNSEPMQNRKIVDVLNGMSEQDFKKKWFTSSAHYKEIVVLAKSYKLK